jgi:acetyl esterase/lipase
MTSKDSPGSLQENMSRPSDLPGILAGLLILLVSTSGLIAGTPTDPTVAAPGKETASIKRLSLWDGKAPHGEGLSITNDAFITVYHPVKPNGVAAVICPGGGYARLSVDPEGYGIARWLNEHGITGVFLEYRLPHGNHALPLLDAQRAIRFIKFKAAVWGCDTQKIGIIGFSAGGHLASTASTHFDAGKPGDPDPINRQSSRPDFAILIYPVITMGAKAHPASRENLLGTNPPAALVDFYSNEKQVTTNTPPTFLAHAVDDTFVIPENSQAYYDALVAKGVPCTYQVLPSGGHGLNDHKGPMWEAWKAASLNWLADRGVLRTGAVGEGRN